MGGGSGGGSFKIGYNVKVTFDNCIFYRNVNEGNEGWAGGGAIFLEKVTEANFTNCVFMYGFTPGRKRHVFTEEIPFRNPIIFL